MNQHKPRILCVDDEPLNLSLLEALLTPRGYEVVPAANGPLALEMIKTMQIDICLLDVMMPGMDGFEVCRRIKADEDHRNIPVIMITVLDDRENRIRGIEAGAEDFTSIEAGKTQVKSVEFNLRDCVNDTVIMQKIITNAKGLALDVEFIGAFPDVLMGDALRLRQILLNLVGNAIKFTALGGIAITVKLDEQKNNRVNVKIAVRDTGIGISHEALGDIFLPYIQEDASATRQYDGAGLGLTLSRYLAELMGGTISVESAKNVGSCFTLTVPFAGVQDNSPGGLKKRIPCNDGDNHPYRTGTAANLSIIYETIKRETINEHFK